jgi:flagellar motor protein MotB
MEDNEYLSFNFWPAFTDLMLAVVLILMLVIGGVQFSGINVKSIQEKQRQLAASLEDASTEMVPKGGVHEVRRRRTRELLYRLSVDPHDPMLQRIAFSDALLFPIDNHKLRPEGRAALLRVGGAIQERLDDLVEIQIHGHADPDPTSRFEDNLDLASRRANEVFRFLQTEAGIDPASHLMSATSFAEFNPAQRARDKAYARRDLERDNNSVAKRQLNRRIELLLFYRKPAGSLR